MSTVITPPAAGARPARPLYRLSVEQYHRMVAQGILKATDRVELLEGCLVTKMTPHPPHAVAVSLITALLTRLLSDDWAVRCQNPVTLKDSEPEPDVAVARGPQRHYAARHLGPREVPLVIEVADSSLMDDRRYKGTLYAAARIAEFWIVNLVEETGEVYKSPRAGKAPAYQEPKVYRRGEAVPLTLDGQAIAALAVNDLLP